MFLVLVMTENLWVSHCLLFLSSVLRRLFILLHVYYWWWVAEHHGQIGHLLGEVLWLILVYYYPQIYYQWLYLIHFGFLLQNLLYEIDYKLLIRKINVFSGCCQGDNLCLCPHILKIQFLVYINISSYHLVFLRNWLKSPVGALYMLKTINLDAPVSSSTA